MAIRPLTREEKQKVAELIGRLEKDSKELYALVAPIITYDDFRRLLADLRNNVFQAIKSLENIRKIRELLGQLPGMKDIDSLIASLEKLRT